MGASRGKKRLFSTGMGRPIFPSPHNSRQNYLNKARNEAVKVKLKVRKNVKPLWSKSMTVLEEKFDQFVQTLICEDAGKKIDFSILQNQRHEMFVRKWC